MSIAAVLVVLVIGTASMFAGDSTTYRWWLPGNASTAGVKIDSIFYIILYITGIAFVIVQVVLAFFVLRSRRPAERIMHTRGDMIMELVWTIVPVLIFIFLAFASKNVRSEIRSIDNVSNNTTIVDAKGKQFE
jgi:cytochrome c oxidase subunit 2